MEKLEKPFLLISKPKGITSRKFLNEIIKIMPFKKMGYAGTLDPMAAGLLFIAMEKATRLLRFADASTKEYVIKVDFGIETDTDDITGNVINRSEKKIVFSEFKDCIFSFKGKIKQTPPVFSAKKFNGKEMYKYARTGKVDVPIKPVDVEIYEIEIKGFINNSAVLRISCSSGTYMRSIARDLGRCLGTYGTLSAIARTKIGKFTIKDATTISSIARGDFSKGFFSIDEVMTLPTIIVEDYAKVLNGVDIEVKHFLLKASSGKIIGVGTLKGSAVHPEVIIDEGS
jgi:tRNA pseudouridine55 synthase